MNVNARTALIWFYERWPERVSTVFLLRLSDVGMCVCGRPTEHTCCLKGLISGSRCPCDTRNIFFLSKFIFFALFIKIVRLFSLNKFVFLFFKLSATSFLPWSVIFGWRGPYNNRQKMDRSLITGWRKNIPERVSSVFTFVCVFSGHSQRDR